MLSSWIRRHIAWVKWKWNPLTSTPGNYSVKAPIAYCFKSLINSCFKSLIFEKFHGLLFFFRRRQMSNGNLFIQMLHRGWSDVFVAHCSARNIAMKFTFFQIVFTSPTDRSIFICDIFLKNIPIIDQSRVSMRVTIQVYKFKWHFINFY